MRCYGIDFTSRPSRKKPIVVAAGEMDGDRVHAVVETGSDDLTRFARFADFEAFLRREGPWCGGFDFPFGLPRAFVEREQAGARWEEVVAWVLSLDPGQAADGVHDDAVFSERTARAFADARGMPARKHREVDRAAVSHSPLKTRLPGKRQVVNPPVGLMFRQGAPRLLSAGVRLPRLRDARDPRVALEAYPGYLAKQLGASRYKNDDGALASVREGLVRALETGVPLGTCARALKVTLPAAIRRRCVEDTSGDSLDAVLALVQAAAGAREGEPHFGLPPCDPVEGWIATVPPPQRTSA